MATGIETERKFALAKGQSLPSLDAIAIEGACEQRELISIYYDTPDYRLNAAQQVIRRRSGGPDAGWQAKLPTDNPDERIEVQLPPGGERLPRELRDLVAASVGERPLLPVAELRTHRSLRELRDEAGRVLAEVCEDRVSATVAGQTQEWTEAEVELVGGDRRLLDAIEAELHAAGVWRSPSRSKLAQALAEQVARLEEAAVNPPAALVVRNYLGIQIGILQALELKVLRNDFDAVHRCRVATRKLRCTLRTFDPAFRPSSVRALREELRWHAEQLGAPRDAEVLKQRLTATLAELPAEVAAEVGEEILSHLAAQHVAAHDALVTSMCTDRYRRLQLGLEQLLADLPLDRMAAEPATVVLPNMFAKAVHRAKAAAVRAEARPSDLTRWHELRKAAKAARYGAEALQSVLGSAVANQVDAWSQVTTALGDLQDAVIAAQVISDLSFEAVGQGRSRAPFDELRSKQDLRLREALTRGRAAVAVALGS
ncbi:CYTH and CHAD domain-containing protein [Propionicimonas sp.]|uniref:CYTH and CHAD domain-containing protein n=1 Tax=Propionicimonas sp. TaxID=1955623 RepID=UPI0018312769|nr:CYTH and CHAD domain-containing protein [Propionicimonas sp.]MBU3977411.1 CYTH and CHAD domain-containing protein [Actinomycetota bacterium]MBA3021335.1 CYTH and CHAD domain-containing protein [Propionicimonas sp.]MBU3985921.1 CYTH and CHAD domain-containing protein [Actinomycetota bacterium]MBU4008706.1 CYTH and CHAD domain-containing protein [Actinomycetota bacterium]MBU4066144.1 CYTH and CHAD domain-containing protein [Actinomycetota bacterium]